MKRRSSGCPAVWEPSGAFVHVQMQKHDQDVAHGGPPAHPRSRGRICTDAWLGELVSRGPCTPRAKLSLPGLTARPDPQGWGYGSVCGCQEATRNAQPSYHTARSFQRTEKCPRVGINSCFINPRFTHQSNCPAGPSAQVSTGVEIPPEPRVSFKTASGIEVTAFSVAAAVTLKCPVLQHQPVVQGAAQPARLARREPPIRHHHFRDGGLHLVGKPAPNSPTPVSLTARASRQLRTMALTFKSSMTMRPQVCTRPVVSLCGASPRILTTRAWHRATRMAALARLLESGSCGSAHDLAGQAA